MVSKLVKIVVLQLKTAGSGESSSARDIEVLSFFAQYLFFSPWAPG